MSEPARLPVSPTEVLTAAGELAERTDRELLEAHVNGEPDAFAVLVTRHRDRLWAVALRTMRNPDDAADALQDAYISAFRRAGTYRGDAQVTTWLHRVVVNACLDRIRRNRVRAVEPLPDNEDQDTRLADAPTVDPIEQQEDSAVVNAALGRLNPDQRAALVLVEMEGYSVEEAATMLGCAAGTVKSRCARGRAKLAPMLRRLWTDPDGDQAAEEDRAGRTASRSRRAAPPPIVRSGTDPPRETIGP